MRGRGDKGKERHSKREEAIILVNAISREKKREAMKSRIQRNNRDGEI